MQRATRMTVAKARKTYQVSDATKHFGQLEASAVKRFKSLNLKNMRLKKILAERDLDREILK